MSGSVGVRDAENQDPTTAAGNIYKTTLSADSQDYISRLRKLETLPLPDFNDYVVATLDILRAAGTQIQAALKRGDSQEASLILGAVNYHLVFQCRKKILSRLERISSAYDVGGLRRWQPNPGEEIPSSAISVSSDLATALDHAGVTRVFGSTNEYDLNTTNLQFWWRAIFNTLDLYKRDVEAENIGQALLGSFVLHRLLSSIPSSVWALPSIQQIITSCRLDTPNADLHSAQNDAEDEDTEIVSSEDVSDAPLRGAQHREIAVFIRTVDTTTAWTTAAGYLVATVFTKDPRQEINLTVVDLPRQTIRQQNPKGLVRHWAAEELWDKRLCQQVEKLLEEGPHNTKAGACHCEAGIIASLACKLAAASSGEEYSELEPAGLREAIRQLTDGSDSSRQYFSIGVSKKCCPSCKLLADVILGTYKVKVQVPGSHTRFHPWVPPAWLPERVLLSLENKILMRLTEILGKSGFTSGSNASSPVSDRGGSGLPPIIAQGYNPTRQNFNVF
ncbi:hypothetical protein B0H16DRAFT_379753 [Mycena metata]|uniref:Uncharacterized protein n=1 Tax=Mycena metata TaxID=1033252 RepID=A0AAD7HIY6_9AGAR|nr:hypothetical protein B0H16DRAFT_379753 [Mycena metata]